MKTVTVLESLRLACEAEPSDVNRRLVYADALADAGDAVGEAMQRALVSFSRRIAGNMLSPIMTEPSIRITERRLYYLISIVGRGEYYVKLHNRYYWVRKANARISHGTFERPHPAGTGAPEFYAVQDLIDAEGTRRRLAREGVSK